MRNVNKLKTGLLTGAAAFAMLVGASAAHAEDYTTGTLKAVIQNEAGSLVADASVIVTSDKGVRRAATTDAEGKIRLPQLPIGVYTVTIEKDGYETLVADKIMISLGSQGSYTFTVDSQNAEIEEIYVVGTRQGSWDFNSTTTGITVNVGEVFERTPIGRNATSIALLAPGTGQGDTAFSTEKYGSTGSSATFSGSSVGENVYYVNGLNVTNFRNAIGGSTIPFEFYDQLEVKTGGYQAEFGRSTGGVINAVTKSGSNEFHFGANAFWEPNAFYEDSPDTYLNVNHQDTTSTVEYNFWASGPIVKDKLFFYGLYNPRDNKQLDCDTGSCIAQERNSPFYGLKLDFVPFDGHRLEYTFFSDKQDADETVYDYDSVSDAIGASKGIGTYENGGVNHIFKYTGALTDWFTISALYGENNYSRGHVADNDDPSILEFRDGAGGSRVGDYVIGSFEFGEDARKAWRVDGDLYFDAFGEHHIRMGWDREKLTATEQTRYSGNAALRYYDSSSSSTGERVRVRQYVNVGDFETTQTALYIQDSWQVLDSLMLNIGFRNETFDNLNAEGDSFVKIKNQKAWRFGFSWDPTDDGRNRVYGSWGRYYLPIATNTNIRMAGKEFYVQQYYELPAGWDQNTPYITPDLSGHVDLDAAQARGQLFTTAANGDPLIPIGGISVYADGTQAGTFETTDANLKPMYQDEWIIGAEHDFNNGWSMGVRFVHRKLGRMIEDIAIDAGVPLWAAANGYDAVDAAATWSGFHQYVLTNPGGTVTVGTEDLKNLDGSDAGLVIMELTPDMLPYPEGKRTYNAIDITFSREWDGKWSLDGSYTWSKSKGNYEGSVKSDNGQDDAGLTTDFDQPGFTDGAYGYLPNDRRHRVKVWGAYAVNDWMTIGGLVNVESPRKFGCIGEHPSDGFAWQYGAAAWFCNGESTPRGSQLESDWTKTIDLSISVVPGFSEDIPGDLVLRLDVFNVLNSKSVVDIRELGDLGFTSDLAFGGTTGPDPDLDYGKPTRYQTPRHVRFSASYKF